MATGSQTQEELETEIAAMNGEIKTIRDLYNRNHSNVNGRGKWDWTPLMRAADNGQNEAVRVLVEECKADINAVGKFGHTALHLAATKGYQWIVEYLTEKRSDINALDAMKRTPIMLASYNGHIETVRYLLSKNAETDRRSSENKTAKDMAREGGRRNVYQMLVERERTECAGVDQVRDLDNKVKNLDQRVSELEGQGLLVNDFRNIRIQNRSRQSSVSSLSTTSVYAETEASSGTHSESLNSFVESENEAVASRAQEQNPPQQQHKCNLSEKLLDKLARQIGNDFRSLGTHLDMSFHTLNQIKDRHNSQTDATFEMLLTWINSLEISDEEKVEKLKSAFRKIKRIDLATELDRLLQSNEC